MILMLTNAYGSYLFKQLRAHRLLQNVSHPLLHIGTELFTQEEVLEHQINKDRHAKRDSPHPS